MSKLDYVIIQLSILFIIGSIIWYLILSIPYGFNPREWGDETKVCYCIVQTLGTIIGVIMSITRITENKIHEK